MNRDGNPGTLVPSYPGNTNAVRHGTHSERLMAERAAEIEKELLQRFEFSPVERLAVHHVARCMAYIKTIDDYLDQHGLLSRTGKPHELLKERARFSRELERWLARISRTIDRQISRRRTEPVTRADYVRELDRIAIGPDSDASTRDQVTALKQLISETKLVEEQNRARTVTLQIRMEDPEERPSHDTAEDEEAATGQDGKDPVEPTNTADHQSLVR